jgi:hypothetical protein
MLRWSAQRDRAGLRLDGARPGVADGDLHAAGVLALGRELQQAC